MEQLDFNSIVTVILITVVPMIYVFRLHKPLLIEGSSAIVSLYLFIILFIVGIIYAALNNFDRIPCSIAVALGSPLYHTILFRYLFKIFVKRMGREPVDVAFNFASGVFPDRLFVIGFILFSVFSSMIIAGIFTWGIAKEM